MEEKELPPGFSRDENGNLIFDRDTINRQERSGKGTFERPRSSQEIVSRYFRQRLSAATSEAEIEAIMEEARAARFVDPETGEVATNLANRGMLEDKFFDELDERAERRRGEEEFGVETGEGASADNFTGRKIGPGVEIMGREIPTPDNTTAALALAALNNVEGPERLRAENAAVRSMGVSQYGLGDDLLRRAIEQEQAVRDQQLSFVQALEAQAAGTGGPSAAEAQLQQGADMALQNAMAVAGAQRGNPFLAARNAQLAGAEAQRAANAQAAQMRAQEQLNAQAMLGNALGGIRGQDQGTQGRGESLSRLGAGLQQQANQADFNLRGQDIGLATGLLFEGNAVNAQNTAESIQQQGMIMNTVGNAVGAAGNLGAGIAPFLNPNGGGQR